MWIALLLDIMVFIIMICAAYQDIKNRKVVPFLQFSLLGVGIAQLVNYSFDKNVTEIISRVGALLFILFIYILVFLICKKGIGGADIKVTSLIAFNLGYYPMLLFMSLHFLAILIYYLFFKIKKLTVRSIPLMPFLLIGYSLTKIIMWVM